MASSTAVVNAGRAIITNRIIGAGTEPKYLAIGTGATAGVTTVALTDTALTTEVETRATCTSSRTTTSTTNDTVQWVGTVTATAGRTVSEVGLFDATSTGNMLVRGVLAASVSLSSGDTITVTANVQVTSSVV